MQVYSSFYMDNKDGIYKWARTITTFSDDTIFSIQILSKDWKFVSKQFFILIFKTINVNTTIGDDVQIEIQPSPFIKCSIIINYRTQLVSYTHNAQAVAPKSNILYILWHLTSPHQFWHAHISYNYLTSYTKYSFYVILFTFSSQLTVIMSNTIIIIYS